MPKQTVSEQLLNQALVAEDDMRACLEQHDFETAERFQFTRDEAFQAALDAESTRQ